MVLIRAGLLALSALWLSSALAVTPSERLPDPALESRAREISAELRCLVCQNQSIDDSDADLAKDLRRLVRERLSAGDSDAAVKEFLVTRYGEFVLLRPVFSSRNLLLWLLPFVALGGGILAARRLFRRLPPAAPESGLTPEEEAALAKLIAPDAAQKIITKNS